ncbi:hypothetical protein YK56LOC_32650 [Caballeronia sp. HLA56]
MTPPAGPVLANRAEVAAFCGANANSALRRWFALSESRKAVAADTTARVSALAITGAEVLEEPSVLPYDAGAIRADIAAEAMSATNLIEHAASHIVLSRASFT